MKIKYLVQPSQQVGEVLKDLFEEEPLATEVILVSAFASRQTLLRLRSSLLRLRDRGALVRMILGIDLGGTSEEALAEALSWKVDTRLVKHRRAGHTFHPKMYLVKRPGRADILIGSSNMTDGGFFTNYEGGILFSFSLPGDELGYAEARTSLQRFLDPTGPTVRVLSQSLLAQLLARRDIPTTEEQRRARTGEGRASDGPESPFGTEPIQPPPPLPDGVLSELVAEVRSVRRRRTVAIARTRARPRTPSPQIVPMSFYMTLPKMRGGIPGEARVPLEARDLAPEFWGWRRMYRHQRGPRGTAREYWNWKPRWRLWNSDNPGMVFVDEVRMYEYIDSSDFRFYAHRLLDLGADEGDVVRIARIAEPGVQFECVLAQGGTGTHGDWLRYCTEPVRNSGRRYGYA